MVITKTDNSSISVALNAIRSVKFADGMMLIVQKDNTQQQISTDDISVISFANVTSAIECITGGNGNHTIVLTDLTGKVLYKGTSADEEIPADIHGNCILTIDGKSQKINLR